MNHHLFIIFIYFASMPLMIAQEKIIYVGDPMCSWCYGFAPQLEKLVETYEGKMEIELVTGGLRPYFEKPINEMKDFLRSHWEDVHNASQQPFNYDILDNTDLKYDTEPACRAVVVVRHMNPQKEFEFFKRIQEAFYVQNLDLRNVAGYDAILNALELDKEIFRKRFNSDEYKALVRADFERAAALGVQGFPSVIFQSGNKLTVIARGYTTVERLNAAIFSASKK